MHLFSADTTMFKKIILLTKSEKTHPQKYLRYTQIFLTAQSCPKRPRQKISCAKMWLIDQLYIKLGAYLREWKIRPYVTFLVRK